MLGLDAHGRQRGLVAVARGLEDLFRGERAAHPEPARSGHDRVGRRDALERAAPPLARLFGERFGLAERQEADFAGGAPRAAMELPVDDDPHSDPRADGDEDEVRDPFA